MSSWSSCPTLSHPQGAATVAQKILHALVQPVAIGGQEVFASASIGVSLFPADATTADDLIRNADAAMYSAKRHGAQQLPVLHALI